MDIKEINSGINQDTHWYYQSKKLPLFDFFRKLPDDITYDIIDVGSGTGFFARIILEEFSTKINKCYLIDIEYTEEEMLASQNTRLVKQHKIPDTISNTLVIMMDVLEHLEHDDLMLNSIKNNCVGDCNYFFITVPAFQTLWSQHDVYLEHFRRYTISSLKNLLDNCKYTYNNIYYLYGTLFPLVWIMRKIANLLPPKKNYTSEMQPASPIVNKVLYTISAFDANHLKNNKLMGVTCVSHGKIIK